MTLDDSLVARPLGLMDQVTCASPDYLQRLGVPRGGEDLEGYLPACEAGYGLVQAPHYHVAPRLREGRLQEVLGDCLPPPLALTVLYPAHRQLSLRVRVRVFVDWLVDLCARPSSGFRRRTTS